MPHTINLLLFGIGNIGSCLIDKAIRQRKKILKEQNTSIRFRVITNSQVAFFDKGFTKYSWETNLNEFPMPFDFDKLVKHIAKAALENTVVIDATNSQELPAQYSNFLSKGFDVLTINEFALQLPEDYREKLALQRLYNGAYYKELFFTDDNKEAIAEIILNELLEYSISVPAI